MNGTLFLEPFGGLGNRMRVIVSGVKLAEYLQKDLKVIWKKGADLNCDYHKLFEPHPGLEILPESGFKKVLSSFNPSPLKRTAIGIFNQIKNINLVICEQDLPQTFFNPRFNPSSLKAHKNIYIRNCEQFFAGEAWDTFKPTREITTLVDSVLRNFTENTVGVHVRRTDNSKSVDFGPLTLFETLMKTAVTKNRDTIFFVASDDPNILAFFFDAFGPEKILTYKKEFTRSTEKGIQDALVDLICLSRCKSIIGSYWSSFTDVAGMMGGVPVVVAKRTDPVQ